MAEYIKKETIDRVFQLRLADKELWTEVEIQVAEWLKADIDSIPAADVQPVKHGHWEEVTDYGGWGDTHYRCSVCGEEWYLEDGKPKDNNMNFCPRCGARMDGEQNEVL